MEDQKKDAQSLFKAAWAAHAQGDDHQAEDLFRRSLEIDPESVEALYGLAIVLKAVGRHSEAIQLFEETIRKIETQKWEDLNRTRMLRRLAVGQINYLRQQDWNLEKEVWQS